MPNHVDAISQAISVIECGVGLVKVLIVEPANLDATTEGGVRVRGVGMVPTPSAVTEGRTVEPTEVQHAVDAALRIAEDIAGIIPRRCVIAIPAAEAVIARGEALIVRPVASVLITEMEVLEAISRARAVALDRARALVVAERGDAGDLQEVSSSLFSVTVDGRRVTRAVGIAGSRLGVSMAVSAAELAVTRNLSKLADALDLDLVGLVGGAGAIGSAVQGRAPAAGAVLIDIGMGSTSVSIVGEVGTEVSVSSPIGVGAYITHLMSVGNLSRADVDALVWGAPGVVVRADRRQLLRAVARPFADAWLDALEARLTDINRGAKLPPSVWICGGGSLLPDLQRAIASGAWLVAHFGREPDVTYLTPASLANLDMNATTPTAVPDAILVPALALGIAAVRAVTPNDPFRSLVSRIPAL